MVLGLFLPHLGLATNSLEDPISAFLSPSPGGNRVWTVTTMSFGLLSPLSLCLEVFRLSPNGLSLSQPVPSRT